MSSKVLRVFRQSVHIVLQKEEILCLIVSGVLEAGIPLHLVALNSYGQVVFKHCRYWIAVSKKATGAMA